MNANRDVVFHIPSLQGGGAERVAVEIARHFVSCGYTPVFFVHAEQADYPLPHGCEVIVAKRTGHFGRVLELAGLLKKRPPRAVVSFLPYANLISILARRISGARTRLVISEHLAFAAAQSGNAKEKLKCLLACWLYQASDSIVAVSTGVALDLQRALKGRARYNVTVIHNPCFVPGVACKASPERHDEASLLAVGRLVDQKGFDVLIRAFSHVRKSLGHATLTIAGEGPNRPRLEALVRELGLSDCVQLPGFLRDTSSLYRNADLFVCSSRFEGFGNVIVEALSYGLRVVSTHCSHGPAEILQDGCFGRLVPVDDDTSLAAAIIESLSAPVDRRVLVARAKDFSLESIGNLYLEQAGLLARRDASSDEPKVIA